MRFVKFHGYGNDYLVFEAAQLGAAGWRGGFERFDVGEPFTDFVRRICDRHFGAGADGVAVVEPLTGEVGADFRPRIFNADFRLRIFNPDGGEAAMSGNGSRCAAAYLHFEGLWAAEELRFTTRAGVKLYTLRGRPRPGAFRFEAEIGRPRFDSASIPMLTHGPLAEVRDYPLALADGETVAVTALQMCNPNCCTFVNDLERVDWRRLGRAIESHAAFPEHTNVEFVSIVDRRNIEARVWERGAGETLSSGTGACAAAVASMIGGRTDRHVRVSMPGGLLEVLWREDGEVLLTGTAEVIYRGEWLEEPGLRTNDKGEGAPTYS
ncbi:MAG: diaminopimelate epimerase [Acidobacteriota bacterium]|jgi:diaminopimelate epimerase|nr:diaminopimelate epimerase [Acidobacteriota bacterium]